MFQRNHELDVVEGRDVGAVVWAAQLRDHLRDVGIAEQDFADVVGHFCGGFEGDVLRQRGAHPEISFFELGHEFAAEESASSRPG